VNNNTTKILSAWQKVNGEKNIWQHLSIEDEAFYFNQGDKKIFLSSFKNKDLPISPYDMTWMGKLLTKLSTFANIMSKRPGTEEVTFYSILEKPHNTGFGVSWDRKVLNIVAPPITWRRIEIEKSIKELIKKYIFDYKESFAFIDIGSGGGFDSLEIERILLGMTDLLEKDILPKEYNLLNIDIDSKWLNNNEKLSKSIFGQRSRIKRHNMSVFEYLSKKMYKKEALAHENVIVCCNGFAEFLSDEDLRALYTEIYDMVSTFAGKVNVILAFANKNPKQEKLGEKIGFKYKAKEKEKMLDLVKEIFVDFKISFSEKHDQIVLMVERSI
jgi:hypothetical protein